MKTQLLIITILILSCNSAKKEIISSDSKNVSVLFQEIETQMNAHYEYVEKERLFEDPVGRVKYLFKVVKNVAPQFITETKLYKDEILKLLTDTTFQKYKFIDEDIAYILYNLPIEDYVDLLNSVLVLFKNGNINQNIFELFIFQDDFVSISVCKNYRNNKLQIFLKQLLEDKNLLTKAKIQNKLFEKAVLNLKNGTHWEGEKKGYGTKDLYKNQRTILETLSQEQ